MITNMEQPCIKCSLSGNSKICTHVTKPKKVFKIEKMPYCKTMYYWGKFERQRAERKKLTPPIFRTVYNFPPDRAQPYCWPTPDMVKNK